MIYPLIDTHCHLDLPVFSNDLGDVINRAHNQGVKEIIIPATTRESWVAVATVALNHPGIHPAYGLHPCFMSRHTETDIDRLEDWLSSKPAIAIGECGLDFYEKPADKSAQIDLFDAQLTLALRFQLPVIIHARKSVEQVINCLKHHPGLTGVLHSFSGSYEQAKQLMDLGFYFGFGGPVTWPRSSRLQAVIKKIPLDRLLLETDAPDQPDARHRNQRNEPSYLPDIACFIAACRGEPVEVLAQQTTENARMLFSLQ